MRIIIVLSILLGIGCSQPKPVEDKKDTPTSTTTYSDTVRNANGAICILYNSVNNQKNGNYLQFREDGDTLFFGAYSNDKKNGVWIYKHPLDANDDTLMWINKLPIDTGDQKLASRFQIVFEMDTIRSIQQKVYYREQTSPLFLNEYLYRDDTTLQHTYWLPNGSKASVKRYLYMRIPHDTSFYYREDGTLDHILIFDHADLVDRYVYDSTGTKAKRRE